MDQCIWSFLVWLFLILFCFLFSVLIHIQTFHQPKSIAKLIVNLVNTSMIFPFSIHKCWKIEKCYKIYLFQIMENWILLPAFTHTHKTITNFENGKKVFVLHLSSNEHLKNLNFSLFLFTYAESYVSIVTKMLFISVSIQSSKVNQ